jgi:hypothetical protein
LKIDGDHFENGQPVMIRPASAARTDARQMHQDLRIAVPLAEQLAANYPGRTLPTSITGDNGFQNNCDEDVNRKTSGCHFRAANQAARGNRSEV